MKPGEKDDRLRFTKRPRRPTETDARWKVAAEMGAKATGTTPEDWAARRARGELWCWYGKHWFYRPEREMRGQSICNPHRSEYGRARYARLKAEKERNNHANGD